MDLSTRDPQRRQFFARVVKTIQAAIGGTLGLVLGGSIVSPSLIRREERWLPAGSLSGLADNAPTSIAAARGSLRTDTARSSTATSCSW